MTDLSLFATALLVVGLAAAEEAKPWAAFQDGRFAWRASAPLLSPDKQAADPHVSIKDPTFVQFDGRWHLFATVRMQSGKVDIGYLSFADWKQADAAPRQVNALVGGRMGEYKMLAAVEKAAKRAKR